MTARRMLPQRRRAFEWAARTTKGFPPVPITFHCRHVSAAENAHNKDTATNNINNNMIVIVITIIIITARRHTIRRRRRRRRRHRALLEETVFEVF